MLHANYILAHNIDDSTNERLSRVVNPRRPFDWMNLSLERRRSTLDTRHRFAMSWIYELPNLETDHGCSRHCCAAGNGAYLVSLWRSQRFFKLAC
jgi:hypothetical protein